MMIKKINSAVIGLGNIGLGISNNKNLNKFFTHCESINILKSYNLKFALDNNKKRRKLFEKIYNRPCFSNLSSVNSINNIDLIVISVSTSSHFAVTSEVIKKFNPKVILIEKPFCEDYKKALILKKICEKKNIKLFVNYPRRVLKETEFIKKLLNNEYTKGRVMFSKGIINNGCHFIDLCNFLFGNFKTIEKHGNLEKIKHLKDYSRRFTVNYPNAKIEFCNQKNNKKPFELIFQNDLVKLQWSQYSKNLKNKKLPILELRIFYKKKNTVKKLNININDYQKNVYTNIINYFKGKKNTLCNSKQGINVKKIINEVIN